jgi:hypothetical protein
MNIKVYNPVLDHGSVLKIHCFYKHVGPTNPVIIQDPLKEF